MASHPETPGKNASISASRSTACGYIAAYAYATMSPDVVTDDSYILVAEGPHGVANALRGSFHV